jgi:hypothetical protein
VLQKGFRVCNQYVAPLKRRHCHYRDNDPLTFQSSHGGPSARRPASGCSSFLIARGSGGPALSD